MSRQTDLHQLIIDDHGLIKSYVAIFQSSNDPRELLRAKQQILDLWSQVVDHLIEYRRLVDPLPGDIAFIAQYIDAGIPPDILAWQPKDEDFTRRPRLPLQRPPRAAHFVDRRAELAQLLTDLQPGRVVTLCGPGGIGKTALAAEALWTLAPGSDPPDRFPDGVLFHSFYGRPDPALALEHIALSFGEEPRPTPADAALRALAGRRALLILDGTEQADDLGMVLDVRGGCGVLVTSRAHKDALAERQDVRPLPPDDAVDLLCKWGGDCAADAQSARQICEWVGRLPLAVRLAGRYLAETGEHAADYLAWLREMPLDALDHGQRRQESVPVLLEKSLAQVGDAARQVLAVVGVLALAPFDCAPVAAALDAPDSHLRRALGELVSYGLLLRPDERYQVSHALVHTYARQHPPDGETVRRLAGYYATLAREQSTLGPSGYAVLDGERAHIIYVLQACAQEALWKTACSLVRAADHYLEICGYWTERMQTLEIGVRSARALHHRQDESIFLGNLGSVYYSFGLFDKAIEHYQQALSAAREIGDRHREETWLGNLGMVYRNQSRIQEAIAHYELALDIARELGDRSGESKWLDNLGSACRLQGEVEKAISGHKQALAIAREIGDRRREGEVSGNLGGDYHTLGQVQTAFEYYQDVLTIAQEIGDLGMEGTASSNLGLAYRDLGHPEQAVDFLNRALEIGSATGNRPGQQEALVNLGIVYYTQGKMAEAIEQYHKALVIAGEIGDLRTKGTIMSCLGAAFAGQGQVEKAFEHLEAALSIAQEIGDRQGEGICSHNIGELYKIQNNAALACQYLQRALTIFEALGLPHYAGESRHLLDGLAPK